MDEGFYRGVEPVAVVSASNTGELRQALRATIARGNPAVPILRRSEIPLPVLLKYAGVKSWSAFERHAVLGHQGEQRRFPHRQPKKTA
jgi:hypothetical protein